MAVPAAPTGFTATAWDGAVKLTWTTPTDATITGHSFQITPGVPTIPNWTLTPIPNSGFGQDFEDNYVVSGLTNGVTYYFSMRAVNPSGTSPTALLVFATPTVGATPTNTPYSPGDVAAGDQSGEDRPRVSSSIASTPGGSFQGQILNEGSTALPNHQDGDLLLCFVGRTALPISSGGSDMRESAVSLDGWTRLEGLYRTAASPINLELWGKIGDGREASARWRMGDSNTGSFVFGVLRILGAAHTPLIATSETWRRAGRSNLSQFDAITTSDDDTLIVRASLSDDRDLSNQNAMFNPTGNTFDGTIRGFVSVDGFSGNHNGMCMGFADQDGPNSPGPVAAQAWGAGANEEWVTLTAAIVHVVDSGLPEHGQIRRFSLTRPLNRQALHREVTVIEVDPDNASN